MERCGARFVGFLSVPALGPLDGEPGANGATTNEQAFGKR